MFCTNCGSQIDDNARFCPECGAKSAAGITGTAAVRPAQTQPAQAPVQGQRVTENIYLCPDGVYRWIYEFKMMKNPTVLFTIWKIFGGIIIGVWLFSVILMLFDGDLTLENVLDSTKNFGFVALGALVLSFIAYVIVAAMNGWKYIVLFEMDENGITHTQMQQQFEKAQAVGWLTAMAGLLTGNFTTAGAGINAAVHDTVHSEFSKVKNIKARRGLGVIKVNEVLYKNQVYADGADFDFVLSYISARIPANAPRK